MPSSAAVDDTPVVRRLFAVADVPVPQMPAPTPAAVPSTPLLVPGQRRDAQTSPTLPAVNATAGTPLHRSAAAALRCGTSPSDGPVSLSSWVRSAKCRLAARFRRSLSAASRVAPRESAECDTLTCAATLAPTPKRLLASGSGVGGVCAGEKLRKRRHASLQRLVQRFTPSPFAASASRTASPLSPADSPGPSQQQSGRVLQLLADGSRAVRLRRQRGAKFGFFVARQQNGVYLTRFNDQVTQLCYRSVIGVGDQILEIEGLSTASMELADMHRFISDRRSLVMRVRNSFGCAF